MYISTFCRFLVPVHCTPPFVAHTRSVVDAVCLLCAVYLVHKISGFYGEVLDCRLGTHPPSPKALSHYICVVFDLWTRRIPMRLHCTTQPDPPRTGALARSLASARLLPWLAERLSRCGRRASPARRRRPGPPSRFTSSIEVHGARSRKPGRRTTADSKSKSELGHERPSCTWCARSPGAGPTPARRRVQCLRFCQRRLRAHVVVKSRTPRACHYRARCKGNLSGGARERVLKALSSRAESYWCPVLQTVVTTTIRLFAPASVRVAQVTVRSRRVWHHRSAIVGPSGIGSCFGNERTFERKC